MDERNECRLAVWPEAEQAIGAMLDALGLYGPVKDRVVRSSDARTEVAAEKGFERFIAGQHIHSENGDRQLVQTLDAILRELAGVGLDDIPGIRQSILDLEDRYIALRCEVPVMWASQDAIDWFVLSRLLVPWAGCLAAECVMHGSQFDSGMPGGRFWFLPERRAGRIVNPLKALFDWWRDLLWIGSQTDFADRLHVAISWPDDAPGVDIPAEISDWVSAKPDVPSLAVIESIASAAERLGRAADCGLLDQGETLAERLGHCAAFACGRKLDADALSLEIPTKRDAIAEIISAVKAQRMPRLPKDILEQFILHMRRRWAVPTHAEIRSRLIVARGSKKLFLGWRERFGEEKALGLCCQFHCAYNIVIELLKMEPLAREKRLRQYLSGPGAGRLFGVLKPIGSQDFLEQGAAFVMGGPDRYYHDPMPSTDMDDHDRAVQCGRDAIMDLVDISADLQLPVPQVLIQSPKDDHALALGDEVRRFSEQVKALYDVLSAPSADGMWLAYILLPQDMPPSAVHTMMARKIVDTVDDLEAAPFWAERFAIALERAKDPALGPYLEVQGLALETWWLTAPHRTKRQGDKQRARASLDALIKHEASFGGWFLHERLWREARLLAQVGKYADAVELYEAILKNGVSNTVISAAEMAWEALAVSSAAGKSGRFKTLLKLSRRHDQRLDWWQDNAIKKAATEMFQEDFCNPFC